MSTALYVDKSHSVEIHLGAALSQEQMECECFFVCPTSSADEHPEIAVTALKRQFMKEFRTSQSLLIFFILFSWPSS